MEKNYRYALRKTTLGVGSVAIGVFLAAGQLETVQAAEAVETAPGTAIEAESPVENVLSANTLELAPEAAPQAVSAAGEETAPAGDESSTDNEVKVREGVSKTEDGQVMTDKENSVSADENKVGNYRDSDLANNGITGKFIKEDNGSTQEGVTVNIVNPSSTSEDKRKFGIQFDIDREKSERTYNGVYVTDSHRGVPIKRGSQGELVKPGEDPDFPGVNYPKNEEEAAKIDHDVSVGRQVNIEIGVDEEFLKDLNNINNKKTNFAWKHNYVTDNPTNKALDGSNFEAGFSVNPYPNENKNLSIIRVVGDTNIEKVPVKGQYIKTGARIENLGEEDYTRITSEVYHPDGTVVDPTEAQAILVTPDNIEEMKGQVGEVALGDIIFKMPKGAIEDEGSIFNNPKFKGIQSLRAEFFARPRTVDEFKKVIADSGGGGKFYVETGAGKETIKHNGQDVTIDKQGIARYDHYNTLGTISVNLDDTKYYDQSFEDENKADTRENTYSEVKPGQEFEVHMYNPAAPMPNQKSADEMKEADKEGRATGEINRQFIDGENKKIADKLGTTVDKLSEDQKWTINYDKDDITKFTVKAPTNAKAGDFIAVPIEYTYTNGSTDTHWFHFVVQESDYNKPEYFAKAGYQGTKLSSKPTLPKTDSDKRKN